MLLASIANLAKSSATDSLEKCLEKCLTYNFKGLNISISTNKWHLYGASKMDCSRRAVRLITEIY